MLDPELYSWVESVNALTCRGAGAALAPGLNPGSVVRQRQRTEASHHLGSGLPDASLVAAAAGRANRFRIRGSASIAAR